MATPVTSPDDETVAMAVLVELHVTVRFARVPPRASRVVAVSWTVRPTVTEDDGGDTSTDATGAGGEVPSPPQAAKAVRHATRTPRTTLRAIAHTVAVRDTFFRGRPERRVRVSGRCTTVMEQP